MTRTKAGAAITAALALAFMLGHTSRETSVQSQSPKVVTKTVTVTKDKVVKVPVTAQTCLDLRDELARAMAAIDAYTNAVAPTMDLMSEAHKAIVTKDWKSLAKVIGQFHTMQESAVSPLARLDERRTILVNSFGRCMKVR